MYSLLFEDVLLQKKSVEITILYILLLVILIQKKMLCVSSEPEVIKRELLDRMCVNLEHVVM